MSKENEARELFQSGANCAQAVAGVFHEECGLDRETALRMASGFGAGMGRLREVCGAVSGMFLVANMKYGPADFGDKAAKDAHYKFIQELAKRFKDETGSLICRELLGLDGKGPDKPVSEARTAEYYKKRPCSELVALAASIMEDAITERAR